MSEEMLFGYHPFVNEIPCRWYTVERYIIMSSDPLFFIPPTHYKLKDVIYTMPDYLDRFSKSLTPPKEIK